MGRCCHSSNRCFTWFIAAGLYLILIGFGGMVVEAGPLYVYTDAQGQAVMTDNLEGVPAEFRGRVRTMAGEEPLAAGAPALAAATGVGQPPSASGMIEKVVGVVAAKVGSRTIKGLTAYQTAVVILAGFCWLALLLLIFLSPNPAIRLLCKFLLVLVGVAAFYQVALVGTTPLGAATAAPQQGSEPPMENILGQMKSKTEKSYRAQDERTTRQMEQVEPPTP